MAELSPSAARQGHRKTRNQWLLTALAETHSSLAHLDALVGAWAPEQFVFSHLGSVMPAVCLTRPQYVLRSYCDSGSSRLPGMEDDMLARGGSGHVSFPCFLLHSMPVCGGPEQLCQLRHGRHWRP